MSTPSTATAPLPPHHAGHYGHSYYNNSQHHHPHSSGDHVLAGSTPTAASSSSARLTEKYVGYTTSRSGKEEAGHLSTHKIHHPQESASKTRSVHHLHAKPAESDSRTASPATVKNDYHSAVGIDSPQYTASAAAMSPRGRLQREPPDWREFYKNGIPEEIIVIEDTPEPQIPTNASNYRHNYQYSAGQNGNSEQHVSKKRRTAGGAPDGAQYSDGADARYHHNHHQNSQTQTTRAHHHPQQQQQQQQQQHHYPDQGSNGTPAYGASASASADRTTSLQAATAATSMGSRGEQQNGYHGITNAAAAASNLAAAGQKRKRTAGRQETAEAKKRREIVEEREPHAAYVPLRHPPVKAGEVPVSVVKDNALPMSKSVDDEDGHFVVSENSPLTNRYQIIRLLGQGTFGKVVEAFDRQRSTRCAVKIIRSVPKYREASKIELRVLSTLAKNDRENRNKCIHLRECFDVRNHICIVTDLYGQSVFDFLKGNSYVPFPSSQIQNFARQLLTSVAFLHDLNLIHTDLKPENILLVNNHYQAFTYNKTIPSSSQQVQRVANTRRVLLDTEIRLIDFGSATFDDEYHSTVVSTRHYRAPEIILNLGWSFPCDIWSIGCILVEFFTGDALFQTHDNLEHLAMMEVVCGAKIDPRLVKQINSTGRGDKSAAKFFKSGRLDYPNKDTNKASRSYVKAMKALTEIIPSNNTFNKLFLDLLRKIFVYDPHRRITAQDALRHPWFRESIIDDGTEAIRIRREREEQAKRKSAV